MNILYAVQGTGNGHLSRAMAIANALTPYPDINVTWLISGREADRQYPGIDNYEWRQGLTLVTDSGKVSIRKTLAKNSIVQFWHDIRHFDFSGYDQVFSDFEPVVAHAARKQGIPVTGISHQCAFSHNVPLVSTGWSAMTILRKFAPVTRCVGLHWHHFGQPVLPPIVHLDHVASKPEGQKNKIVVYLPMENPVDVIRALTPLSGIEFYFYHPDNRNEDLGHIQTRAISTTSFKQDLYSAHAIICNSGFELISECLVLGKAVLTKPLYGQLEQLSNAKALEILGYATVRDSISTKVIQAWLESDPKPITISYPDVAARLARWIVESCKETPEELALELWQEEHLTALS